MLFDSILFDDLIYDTIWWYDLIWFDDLVCFYLIPVYAYKILFVNLRENQKQFPEIQRQKFRIEKQKYLSPIVSYVI